MPDAGGRARGTAGTKPPAVWQLAVAAKLFGLKGRDVTAQGQERSDAALGQRSLKHSSTLKGLDQPRRKALMMQAKKRKALESAGWKFGDAADFQEMSAEERQLLEARVELAIAVRRQREARNLSQKQLGALLKTSQPRVAKIERAAADVSLDQIVRALAAAGGKISVVSGDGKTGRRKNTTPTALNIKVATAS